MLKQVFFKPKLRQKLRKTSLVLAVIVLSASFSLPTLANDRFCITERCKSAAKAAQEAENNAKTASANAKTLEGTIAALNAEIAALNAEIAAGQARAADLKNQITLAEAKLKTQQTALAKMIVDLHFSEEDDAMTILAGSQSLSDFTEKQARADTAQSQIATAAKSIEEEKKALETQKLEVDRIILNQQNARNVITNREAEQQRLKQKYAQDATNFAADAEAARKIKAEEIAKEIARYNQSGVVGNGINSYPYKNACPAANLSWADSWGYVCQCVHYTGYKAKERWGVHIRYWGNAYSWDDNARLAGYRVDTTPAIHTIAVSNLGAYGHVMWVESVNANGTINVSEYNNPTSSQGRWGDYGYRANVNPRGLYFIHFQ